ncbi:hypothetical protein LF887_07790 [Chryseobacterium sp. MEBOG06]|uniref:hypothetical protein n=1 Tax=Chryseobacterium sp. MEBOG06 TaxID=2879938 RepID=UPI001F3C9A95|nr:hypothetical protein [Chryseobacterium sp. MEBOG06]UKB85510.1 hypothetical protein LF887_07790 [Chryseobacterium sp. MEBOG06]
MRILNVLFFFLISFYGFGQQKTDTVKKEEVFSRLVSIDISKIKTPCDCSDAMERIADCLVKITDPFSSKQEMENDRQVKNFIDLSNVKTAQVASQCEKKLGFRDSDIFECKSFKQLKEKSAILNRKFRK